MDTVIGTKRGLDVLMNKICGCEKCTKGWTLSDCEEKCDRYYSCDNVAIANDILVQHEKEFK